MLSQINEVIRSMNIFPTGVINTIIIPFIHSDLTLYNDIIKAELYLDDKLRENIENRLILPLDIINGFGSQVVNTLKQVTSSWNLQYIYIELKDGIECWKSFADQLYDKNVKM